MGTGTWQESMWIGFGEEVEKDKIYKCQFAFCLGKYTTEAIYTIRGLYRVYRGDCNMIP